MELALQISELFVEHTKEMLMSFHFDSCHKESNASVSLIGSEIGLNKPRERRIYPIH
jgi:hypothetical protein